MPRRARFCCVLTSILLGALLLFLSGPGARAAVDSSSCIRLALAEDPLTLDPAYITDVSAGAISAKIFDGLVRFDMEGRIQPCLAESWQILAGGKVYVFALREDVYFHNGRRLVAGDVRQSFERILNAATNSPRRWVLGRIMRIETPDARTVRIELAEPYAPFLSLLAMPNAAVIPVEEAEQRGARFGQQPVGSGPFLVERWDRDKALLLKKNPSYFTGAPGVDGVEYRVIPEPWAAVTEFMQGRLDWISVPQSHMEEFLSDPAMAARMKSRAGLNTYYLGFNCARPPLNNPKVRKALAMAIDRRKMAGKLMQQRAMYAAGPVPPALEDGYLQGEGIAFDPTLARQWLQEERVAGLQLTLYQASSQDTQEVMEVVQDYLARVGVKVHIVQREWSSFKAAVAKGEPDMYFLSWWADYPDPENFLFPNFFSGNAGAGGNKSFYADVEFDRLIQQAISETDAQHRRALYRLCVARIVDQSPWAFLWHRTEWVIQQPWVRGLALGLLYNADKFTGIRLEQKDGVACR